ncbi:hypothetical protein [Bacteroides sp. UBA939]|uniref:hypothetical protein n=1 Tax=Bacteroides sp. UBA939 TaxID=1946092 RepID=UPI0025BC95A3|nr:hypothetical protein [Bacteroides sp. UBA939]
MKNKKTKWIYIVLSITLVLCAAIRGCYSKNKLDNPNPTSYIFDASIEQVRIAIVNNAEKIRWYHLWSEIEDKETIHYTDIKMDAWLNCHGGGNNVLSKIYFRFGKPLPYFVEFHLHLDSISEHKTKVEIFTLDPEIFLFGIGYGHIGFSRSKKVPPSTIEEYEILLAIGEQLGERDMPPCNYPKKWLKYQAKEQERIRKQKAEFEKLKSKQ